jgi:menaquinone reductase, molybdopterin-binding-like subunit
MNRRNFIKLSAVSGAMATLDSCGSPDHQLIRFIPDEELVPGIATWKPSVCTLCPAGCGLLVRVMAGEAEVLRKGQKGLVQMGLAKKLEGNPQHPVNLGKLCARGQAGLQVVYNPDRLRNPIKRSGERGSGQFQEISWDDALKELTAHLTELRSAGDAASLAFLSRPLRGQRGELIARFLKAFGAPPPVAYEPLDEAVLRRANLLSFGHAALPTVDLGRADYLISFGADFLGTWNSPVSQSIGFGEMRQGRAGRRGKFVQVEPRMSQTGANADEWIPCRPGMEGVLALGIANVIMREKLSSRGADSHAGALIEGWTAGLPEYSPDAVEKQTGVAAATIGRLAHEIAQRELGAAIIGGAPLAQTNGLFSALAVNALDSLVDGGHGGPAVLSFSAAPPLQSATPAAADQIPGQAQGSFAGLNALTQAIVQGQPHAPKVLMVDNANPVFSAPPGARVREAILKVPYMVSFGSFLDETSSVADLILPDHAPLESWLDDVPESGATLSGVPQAVVSLAPPALRPLYSTRAMPDVILAIAQQLGGNVAAAVPWKTFDDMLRAAFVPLRLHSGSISAKTDDEFWSMMQEQGGWWSVPAAGASPAPRAAPPAHPPVRSAAPEFDGAAGALPFHFLPYASQALGDGSLAHLPWLQELPDVMTSAMWSSWVEVNPKTASEWKIETGDVVEIASQHGTLRAPAIVSPGIAPDVLAMPVGQGHQNFGRYASGRGANPLAILAPVTERETGALAWAATRVKLTRIGKSDESKLILFAGGMSGFPVKEEPR